MFNHLWMLITFRFKTRTMLFDRAHHSCTVYLNIPQPKIKKNKFQEKDNIVHKLPFTKVLCRKYNLIGGYFRNSLNIYNEIFLTLA